MLGSLEESEDMVQDSLLRAWQAIGRYEGRSSVRTWLHRIATNACLDLLARRQRRRQLLMSATGDDTRLPAAVVVPWPQPYPDSLLDEAVDPVPDPATPQSPARPSNWRSLPRCNSFPTLNAPP